ncbi:hypothetical protein D3H55_22155 [Bacillus salacetis]|uniref:Carbon-nitrogen hydrolase family protein n=1 Tax=Bacillus salacetis TaxID=2315464 RepID=A0A3A1QPD2_9BACI|nr:hypothetical protein [Bacillus salacetis]RIW28209.1 hypothetical protein D3H55_22155 [Bacillus salacetis]
MEKLVKVTVAQVTDGSTNSSSFLNLFDIENGLKYKEPHNQLNRFFKGVKVAKEDNSNFLVFPELFLPHQYLKNYVSHVAEKFRFIIIGGIEWLESREQNGNRTIENHAFIAIPSVLEKGSKTPHSKATIIEIPKMFPAPAESVMLDLHKYQFQGENKIYLFESKALGNWAILVCFDYLNLPVQKLLQAKIQTLFVVAYNSDLGYFHTLSDTLHRILFCNVVVCNTGNYGGSHSFTPYRSPHKRQRYEISGNQVDAITTIELPLKDLAKEQKAESHEHNSDFMHKPANFSL